MFGVSRAFTYTYTSPRTITICFCYPHLPFPQAVISSLKEGYFQPPSPRRRRRRLPESADCSQLAVGRGCFMCALLYIPLSSCENNCAIRSMSGLCFFFGGLLFCFILATAADVRVICYDALVSLYWYGAACSVKRPSNVLLYLSLANDSTDCSEEY